MPDCQRGPDDAIEGRDGAEVVVVGIGPVSASGQSTVRGARVIVRSGCGGAVVVCAWDGPPRRNPHPPATCLTPVKFASLVFLSTCYGSSPGSASATAGCRGRRCGRSSRRWSMTGRARSWSTRSSCRAPLGGLGPTRIHSGSNARQGWIVCSFNGPKEGFTSSPIEDVRTQGCDRGTGDPLLCRRGRVRISMTGIGGPLHQRQRLRKRRYGVGDLHGARLRVSAMVLLAGRLSRNRVHHRGTGPEITARWPRKKSRRCSSVPSHGRDESSRCSKQRWSMPIEFLMPALCTLLVTGASGPPIVDMTGYRPQPGLVAVDGGGVADRALGRRAGAGVARPVLDRGRDADGPGTGGAEEGRRVDDAGAGPRARVRRDDRRAAHRPRAPRAPLGRVLGRPAEPPRGGPPVRGRLPFGPLSRSRRTGHGWRSPSPGSRWGPSRAACGSRSTGAPTCCGWRPSPRPTSPRSPTSTRAG